MSHHQPENKFARAMSARGARGARRGAIEEERKRQPAGRRLENAIERAWVRRMSAAMPTKASAMRWPAMASECGYISLGREARSRALARFGIDPQNERRTPVAHALVKPGQRGRRGPARQPYIGARCSMGAAADGGDSKLWYVSSCASYGQYDVRIASNGGKFDRVSMRPSRR